MGEAAMELPNLTPLFSGVGTALVTAIAGYLFGKQGRKKEDTSQYFKFFLKPDGPKFNEPFYEHLLGKFKNAKRQIYVTGEGFGERSSRVAHEYHDAVNAALRRGVRVVRIQTSRDTSKMCAD